MAVAKKNKYRTSEGDVYLTKRVLLAKAKSAGKKAELKAMHAMGFTVVVMDKRVVRKFADGRIEPIAKIS